MLLHIQIAEVAPLANPSEIERHDPLLPQEIICVVTAGDAVACRTLNEDVLDGASLDFLADLTWLFETYLQHEPFQQSRADRILLRLGAFKKALFAQIITPSLWRRDIDDVAAGEIVISVRSCNNETSPFDLLRWELLEDAELWRASSLDEARFEPPTVTVIRCSEPDQAHPFAEESSAVEESVAADVPLRQSTGAVLAVAARPRSQDIPIRLITRAIATAAHHTGRLAKCFEIVRPGTFSALLKHLDQRPGYFELIHLDLHGDVDPQLGAFVVFIRFDRFNRVRSHKVYASELSLELKARGVRFIVLNACRSAAHASSFVKTLVSNGIEAAFGMSYKLFSSGAETCMQAFYQAWWGGQAVHTAAASARRSMLLHSSRQSAYGFELQLGDSSVPVIYCSSSYIRQMVTSQTEGRPVFGDIPDYLLETGREEDVLQIEIAMCRSQRLLITGPLGVGKTTLLKSLCAWWETTGFFRKVVWTQVPELTADDYWEQVRPSLGPRPIPFVRIPIGDEDNDSRVLVMIDNLSTALGSHEAQQAFTAQLRGHFGRHTHCKFILISRGGSRWLEKMCDATYELQGLRLVVARSLARQCLPERLVNTFSDPTIRNTHNSTYWDAVLDLAAGNPLAIQLLCRIWEANTVSCRDLFTSLLRGEALQLDLEKLLQDESMKSIQEVTTCIDRIALISGHIEEAPVGLTMPFAPLTLLPFWHRLPQQHMLYHILIIIANARVSGVMPSPEGWSTQRQKEEGTTAVEDSLLRNKAHQQGAIPRIMELLKSTDSISSIVERYQQDHTRKVEYQFDGQAITGDQAPALIVRELAFHHLALHLTGIIGGPTSLAYQSGERKIEESYLTMNPIFSILLRCSPIMAKISNPSTDPRIYKAAAFKFLATRASSWPSSQTLQTLEMDPTIECYKNFVYEERYNFYAALLLATDMEWPEPGALNNRDTEPSGHHIAYIITLTDRLVHSNPGQLVLSVITIHVAERLADRLMERILPAQSRVPDFHKLREVSRDAVSSAARDSDLAVFKRLVDWELACSLVLISATTFAQKLNLEQGLVRRLRALRANTIEAQLLVLRVIEDTPEQKYYRLLSDSTLARLDFVDSPSFERLSHLAACRKDLLQSIPGFAGFGEAQLARVNAPLMEDDPLSYIVQEALVPDVDHEIGLLGIKLARKPDAATAIEVETRFREILRSELQSSNAPMRQIHIYKSLAEFAQARGDARLRVVLLKKAADIVAAMTEEEQRDHQKLNDFYTQYLKERYLDGRTPRETV